MRLLSPRHGLRHALRVTRTLRAIAQLVWPSAASRMISARVASARAINRRRSRRSRALRSAPLKTISAACAMSPPKSLPRRHRITLTSPPDRLPSNRSEAMPTNSHTVRDGARRRKLSSFRSCLRQGGEVNVRPIGETKYPPSASLLQAPGVVRRAANFISERAPNAQIRNNCRCLRRA